MDAQKLIAQECDEIKAMLLAKNLAYGNSALDPVRVFSRATTDEQIRVRLDDKLSRLSRGSGAETEDVIADILGYLVLLRVSQKLNIKADIAKSVVGSGLPRETLDTPFQTGVVRNVERVMDGGTVHILTDTGVVIGFSVDRENYALSLSAHIAGEIVKVYPDDACGWRLERVNGRQEIASIPTSEGA